MTDQAVLSGAKCDYHQLVDVSLIEPSQIDDAFRAEWCDLDQNLDRPNPFFCSWFLEPAIKYLAPREGVRLGVIRRARDGQLVGLVPLVMGDTYAKIPLKHFKVWLHDHCYNGAPLIRTGFAQDVYAALIGWIDTHPDGARFLRFVEHPLSADTEREIDEACARNRRSKSIQYYRERAIFSRGQDADEIITSTFNAKKRKELRRQARRLDELGGVNLQHLIDGDEILQAADAFGALEMSGWKGRREGAFPVGRNERERAFFREAMSAGARAGVVSCDQLSVNGAPAAMLFIIRSGGAVSAFKVAHDETLNAYSPGVQILMEATKRMLGDPTIRHFDSCARSGHPVADSMWRERMGVAQFNIPASGALDGLLLRICALLEKAKGYLLGSGRSVVRREHE